MDRLFALVAGFPPGVLAAIAVACVIQLVLQIYALVDLSRRAEVAGGRKWFWVLIIIVGNILGAIAYLAVGRQTGATLDARADDGTGRERATRRAIDRLYGDKS